MRGTGPHDTSFDPVFSAPDPSTIEYAGFLIRFLAYLIDSLILTVIVFIILAPALICYMAAIFVGSSNSPNTALMMIGMLLILVSVLAEFIVLVLYFVWFESSRFMGTPGKILVHIKVVDADGGRISFLTALLRFILKTILNQFFWIGSLAILFTDKKQGLYDMLMNTYVIKGE